MKNIFIHFYRAMEVTFVRMFVMWYDFDAIFNMTKLSKVIDECAIYMVPFISKVRQYFSVRNLR